MEDEQFDQYVDPFQECLDCDKCDYNHLVHADTMRELMKKFNEIQRCIARCEKCLQSYDEPDYEDIAKRLRKQQEQAGKKKGDEDVSWYENLDEKF